MSFDRSNPADLLALKTEVETDPIAMGYQLNNPTQIVRLLNDPSLNLGGDTVSQELTVALLLDVTDPSDLDAQQVGDGERRFIESFLGRDLGENIDRWKAKIQSAFKVNSPTSLAIGALERPISRAEVLFGVETVLVREDWYAARNS
jgi:hypothetical protein